MLILLALYYYRSNYHDTLGFLPYDLSYAWCVVAGQKPNEWTMMTHDVAHSSPAHHIIHVR